MASKTSRNTPPKAPCAILRIGRTVALTGLSKSTIRRLELEGRFPRRVRLSERLVGHSAAAVFRWIEEREGV